MEQHRDKLQIEFNISEISLGKGFSSQIDINKHESELHRPISQSNLHGNPYVLSYVCLLAPRFVEHKMIGDLIDRLQLWVKEICISFGWKLDYIEINPGYIQWVITVSINDYPTFFMKKIRKETSKKIFSEFPRFRDVNVGADFWAPWYVVSIGQAPFPYDEIQKILEQIRREQGVY